MGAVMNTQQGVEQARLVILGGQEKPSRARNYSQLLIGMKRHGGTLNAYDSERSASEKATYCLIHVNGILQKMNQWR